jgi:ATP-dependent DNA helicase 2 subunit 1
MASTSSSSSTTDSLSLGNLSTLGSESAASSSNSSGGAGSLLAGGSSLWDELLDMDESSAYGEAADPEQAVVRAHGQKDSIMFLVDCTPVMFAENAAGEVPFDNAIKCAIATLTDKIISNENDLVGVCLYGTRRKHEDGSFDGVYLLQGLEPPDAQKILQLEALLGTRDYESSFGGSYEGEFPFAEALWAVSSIFTGHAVAKAGTKRVFLFTNEDNPNAGQPGMRERSITRGRDLAQVQISIELFCMNKPGDHQFDPSLFYEQIIAVDEEEDSERLVLGAAAKFEELQARVRRKEFKKRALGRIPLRIGTELEVGLRIYNLQQTATKGSYTLLDNVSNQPVKSTTKWVCEHTGTVLQPQQIARVYPLGGVDLEFTTEELAQIKAIDQPGLQLMGFKPRSSLKAYHNVRHASFVYPDDTTVQGSSQAFGALLEKMLELNQIGIGRLTPRRNQAPRMVALLPQRETADDDGTQLFPPGWHVIYLPFADDIRTLELPPPGVFDADDVKAAKAMIKKLRIRFDSSRFENPALQRHYANLQALALDRDDVDEVPDHTLPDLEGMAKYKELMEAFNRRIYDSAEAPAASSSVGSKRRTPAVSSASKRPRVAAADIDWDQMSPSLVQKQTVAVLRGFLCDRKVHIPSSTRKAALVELALQTLGR